MADSDKLLVTVTRQIPYDRLIVREKIELAQHTQNMEELIALATDKSFNVRKSLLERSTAIPDVILGKYLINDKNEEIKEIATECLLYKLNKYNAPKLGNGCSKLLAFLCTFFSRDFIAKLDTVGAKKAAIAAVYLYDVKFGFLTKSRVNFDYYYKDEYRNFYRSKYNTVFGLQTEYEPWADWLWWALERVAIYSYFPEKIEEVLKNNKNFVDGEIENIAHLKDAIRADEKDEKWIKLLASVIFCSGSPKLDFIEQNSERDWLAFKLQISLRKIIEADEVLQSAYKTSLIFTRYNEGEGKI